MTEPRYKLPSNAPTLIHDDAYGVKACVGLWLRVRADACKSAMERSILYQLAADADHSALLHRILTGKPPLDKPPPLSHGYPDYAATEREET